MTTHGRMTAALCASLLIVAARAAAADEIVVYGKRQDVRLELDRAAVRIDLERERRELRASFERALAGLPKLAPLDRVASASEPAGR